MAANLTPEQLRLLQQMGGMYGDGTYYDEAAQRMYSPLYGNARMSERNGDVDGAWTRGDPTSYWGYDKEQGTPMTEMNGKGYDIYDPTGKQTGSGTLSGYDGLKGDAADIAKAMAIVGTVGFGGAALMGAGGLGGAGAGAAGASGAAGGVAPYTFGVNGAIGAYPAAMGAGAGYGTALGSAAGGALGAAAGGGGGAGGAGGAGLSEMGLAGEGAFTGTNAAGGAATGSGVGGATMGAAGGGGLLSTLGGTLGQYGSLIAPLLGAAAGAQGNEAETSSTRKMDPRLDGPVYGEGGLVPRTQGLLAEQMSPEAQQGWLDMQNKGRGLLSTNVAPNGFGLFSGRKF